MGDTLLVRGMNIAGFVVDLVFECSILGHELVGQFLGRYRFGVVAGQGRHNVAEAAANVLKVVVDGAVLVHDGLAGAGKGRVLELDAVSVLERSVVEGRMDDRASLLHF